MSGKEELKDWDSRYDQEEPKLRDFRCKACATWKFASTRKNDFCGDDCEEEYNSWM